MYQNQEQLCKTVPMQAYEKNSYDFTTNPYSYSLKRNVFQKFFILVVEKNQNHFLHAAIKLLILKAFRDAVKSYQKPPMTCIKLWNISTAASQG